MATKRVARLALWLNWDTVPPTVDRGRRLPGDRNPYLIRGTDDPALVVDLLDDGRLWIDWDAAGVIPPESLVFSARVTRQLRALLDG